MDVDLVADLLAQGVEGHLSDCDLSGSGRHASGNDLGFDRAAQLGESPGGHRPPVDLHALGAHRADITDARYTRDAEVLAARTYADVLRDRVVLDPEVERPPVQLRSRDEMIEARGEDEHRDDAEHPERATDECGPYGDCRFAASALERHAQAVRERGTDPGLDRALDDRRTRPRAPTTTRLRSDGRVARTTASSENSSTMPDDGGHSDREHRPVDVQARIGIGAAGETDGK